MTIILFIALTVGYMIMITLVPEWPYIIFGMAALIVIGTMIIRGVIGDE